MLSKNITYTNPFTNEEATETHWFHISKSDLIEMDMEDHKETYEKDGETLTGFRAKMQRIVDAEDGKEIMAAVKDMVRRAYGVRNGNSFRKSDEIWNEFSGTEAYSQLLWELCTDPEVAAEFMNGIIPADLEKAAEDFSARAQTQESPAIEVVNADPTGLTTPVTPRVLTRAQALAMDSDEFNKGMAEGKYKVE